MYVYNTERYVISAIHNKKCTVLLKCGNVINHTFYIFKFDVLFNSEAANKSTKRMRINKYIQQLKLSTVVGKYVC